MRSLFGHPIELLCIDLDDTLLDTEAGAPARFAAAAAILRTVRPDLLPTAIEAAVQQGLRTHPTEGRMANFLAELDVTSEAEIAAVRAAYFDRMAERLELFDGVEEVLADLRRDFRVALITNGPSDQQREKLARFDLESQVDWVVISEEVGYEKPDRRIFEHTMSLAGVDPAHTAHVGDSLVTDVAGANDAGLHAIWLRSSLASARPDEVRLTPAATITHVRELLLR